MPEERISYFEFQAEIGLTKHIGGTRATDELVKSCHIKKSSYVLEIGCGVGLTPVYLAKKYECRIMAVDLSKEMIEKAKERAEKKGVAHKINFVVADARKLPFKDNLFDAVMLESVMAFIPDKKKAMKEFMRVVKPGGYIGFTEVAWVKKPPADMEKKMNDFAGSKLLSPEEWKGLLVDAGLKNVSAKTYKLNMMDEVQGELSRWDIIEYLKVQYRAWSGLITKPSYRRFVMDALKLPWNVVDYWGYGVYVGKKKG